MPRKLKQFKIVYGKPRKDGTRKKYVYDAAKYRGRKPLTGKTLLIGKGGKSYMFGEDKRWQTYMEKLQAEGATTTELNKIKAELQTWAKNKERSLKKFKETGVKDRFYGQRLTIKGLEARTVKNKYASMIINTGMDLEDAAGAVGATEADLIDSNNWISVQVPVYGEDGKTVVEMKTVARFKSPDGNLYEFVFDKNYYADIWKNVGAINEE